VVKVFDRDFPVGLLCRPRGKSRSNTSRPARLVQSLSLLRQQNYSTLWSRGYAQESPSFTVCACS
jgi:hypothetical protein